MSSQKRLRRTPEGWSRTNSPSSVCVADKKAVKIHNVMDLPPHLQRHILGSVPLQQLCQLACLNKELRAAYLERVNERDAVVANLLESHFTAEFREGLSSAETALPRDLIVDPRMNSLLQAAPDKCLSLTQASPRYGGQYQGFCMAGSRHGRGKCRYANGDTYLGDWHGGTFHGRGTQVLAKGGMYVGEWYEGKAQGHGTYTCAIGDKYEGAFLNDERLGKGRYERLDGNVCFGEWVSGKMHGKGRYVGPNGDVYVGEWVSHVKHGLGRETLVSGESYFGDFKNGKRDGQGTLTYADGRKYVGCWKEGTIVQGGFT